MESNKELVEHLIKANYLHSRETIDAFLATDRKDFVPEGMKARAYDDDPLPIGCGQTISQPSTVAIMTEALLPGKGMKILEVGTGSGYQAAILSKIAGKNGKVITIERKEEMFAFARKNLSGLQNVVRELGDGSLGYEKEAPFDRIIVTAAAPSIPSPLKEQLKKGGMLLLPVGILSQDMVLVIRTDSGFEEKRAGEFRFVPLVGKHGFQE